MNITPTSAVSFNSLHISDIPSSQAAFKRLLGKDFEPFNPDFTHPYLRTHTFEYLGKLSRKGRAEIAAARRKFSGKNRVTTKFLGVEKSQRIDGIYFNIVRQKRLIPVHKPSPKASSPRDKRSIRLSA